MIKKRGFLKRKGFTPLESPIERKRYKTPSFLTGFTLIELMIVITIIGVLLVILLPRITLLTDKAREKTLHKNLKNIKLALDSECENADGGYNYPTTAIEFRNILERKFDVIPRAVLRITSGVPPSNECYVTDDVANIPVGPPLGGGWVFITEGKDRGRVCINSIALDTEGRSYLTYECW